MKDATVLLTLDVLKSSQNTTLTAKVGDTGRQLRLRLTEGGHPYPLAPGCLPVFTGRKTDGTQLYNECTVFGDEILYTFTPQTCSLPGPMACEIRLYGPEGKLLTTASFLLEVVPTVYREDALPAAGEVTALTALVARANDLITQVNTRLESGAFRGEKGEKGDPGEVDPALVQSLIEEKLASYANVGEVGF